jgi:predicted dehydrogenase
MSTIHVAVIATGFGKAVHISGLKHHSSTEVIAIYNHDLVKSKAIADSQQIPYVFDDFKNLLSLSKINAVSLSGPLLLH